MENSPPSPLAASRWIRHLFAVAIVLALVAMLKGLRMPNLWAATHYTFDYSEGFIRRGLVGEILRHLVGPRACRYEFIASVGFGLFAITVILLALLIQRVARVLPADVGAWGAIFVFLASPGLVFLIHLVGYLDYVGIAVELAIVLFVFDSPRRRAALVPVLVSASIGVALIHESALVLVAPTLVFVEVSNLARHPERLRSLSERKRRIAWLAPPAVLAGAALATIVVGLVGTRAPDVIHRLKQHIQERADFPLRGDAFDVLRKSVLTSIRYDMPRFWREPGVPRYFLRGLAVTLPALSYLLLYGSRLIRASAVTFRTRLCWSVSFFGASLAPLLMVFVGWDFVRWDAQATLAAFVCVCVLKVGIRDSSDISGRATDSPFLITLAAIAVVLGLCSNFQGFLFDGYGVHWFPFDDRWDQVRDLLSRSSPFIPRS